MLHYFIKGMAFCKAHCQYLQENEPNHPIKLRAFLKKMREDGGNDSESDEESDDENEHQDYGSIKGVAEPIKCVLQEQRM